MGRTTILAAAVLAAFATAPLMAQDTHSVSAPAAVMTAAPATTATSPATTATAPAVAITTTATPAATSPAVATNTVTPSTVESAEVQARFAPFAATKQGAVRRLDGTEASEPAPAMTMVRRRARTGQSTALMIVGGVGIILGAAIGGDAGELLMLGSGAVGLYGLYLYLQ